MYIKTVGISTSCLVTRLKWNWTYSANCITFIMHEMVLFVPFRRSVASRKLYRPYIVHYLTWEGKFPEVRMQTQSTTRRGPHERPSWHHRPIYCAVVLHRLQNSFQSWWFFILVDTCTICKRRQYLHKSISVFTQLSVDPTHTNNK